MKASDIHPVIDALSKAAPSWDVPAVTLVAETSHDPFRVLISTVLSLRTKDETTAAASRRLFVLADNPADMLRLSEDEIAKAIYPVGFYRVKARNVLDICRTLARDYGSRVPDDLDELLKLKGVGRKTANLVLTLGYNKPGICVDTHVHRIANRLGWVRTGTPDETEQALYAVSAPRWWPLINLYLVTWGQNVCRPVYPRCGTCAIKPYCRQVGVSAASSR